MEAILLTVALLVLNPTPKLVVWDEARIQGWAWNGAYYWHVINDADMIDELCVGRDTVLPVQACVNRLTDGSCEVFTPYPEWLAKVAMSYSWESLWAHEMKHCAGLVHRSIFDPAEA